MSDPDVTPAPSGGTVPSTGAGTSSSAAGGGSSPAAGGPISGEATDRSPWNWLLFLPIVVPLVPALFNMDSPRLFGFPTFYWLQLAFIVLGVTTTSVVYRMTRNRR